jgi:serpin B
MMRASELYAALTGHDYVNDVQTTSSRANPRLASTGLQCARSGLTCRRTGLGLLLMGSGCLLARCKPPQIFQAHSFASTPVLNSKEPLATELSEVDQLDNRRISSAVNQFGLSLLSTLHQGTVNAFMSPFSISTALGMVAIGATDGSQTQNQLLGLWRMNQKTTVPFFLGLQRQYQQLTDGQHQGVRVLNANSVWLHSSIKDAFKQEVSQVFAADVMTLPKNPDPINNWCSVATNGMIPSIIDEIDPLTRAVLVNAIYFKGNWSVPFEQKNTYAGMFTRLDGTKDACEMMLKTDDQILYTKQGDVQVVEIPYGSDGTLAATVLLPEDGSLESLIGQLGGDAGASLLDAMLYWLRATRVELHLPRFRLKFGVHDLKPELMSRFGLTEPFNGYGGFLKMSDAKDLHLSKVLHKAVLEVNEEGTTAAAATAAVMMEKAVMSEPILTRVIVDRPFIFLIRDSKDGMILFAGIVNQPELK